MEFEFDPSKSQFNQEKHAIDFVAAQALWKVPALLKTTARTLDEPRWLVIGRIQRKHWSAVITLRGQAIRLISVRRSRPEEIQLYEQL
jgi:uncharacterized DUF497 family protein